MKKLIFVLLALVLVLVAFASIGGQRIGLYVEGGQNRYLIHDYLHITNNGPEMKGVSLSIRVYRADGTCELVQENYPEWKKNEKKVVPVELIWDNRITRCEFNGTYAGGKIRQESNN